MVEIAVAGPFSEINYQTLFNQLHSGFVCRIPVRFYDACLRKQAPFLRKQHSAEQ
jgi:hypothetical protein